MPARPESVRPSQERSDTRPEFNKHGQQIGTWYSGRALDEQFSAIEDRQRNALKSGGERITRDLMVPDYFRGRYYRAY